MNDEIDGYARFRHSRTGAEYWGRRWNGLLSLEPAKRQVGDEPERTAVWTTITSANGTVVADRQVWVRTEYLEPMILEPEPDDRSSGLVNGEDWGEAEHRDVEPFADRMLERQQQLTAMAMELAGEQTFHAGNALLALVDGDLHVARAALDQEIARRYPAAITTPEEASA